MPKSDNGSLAAIKPLYF